MSIVADNLGGESFPGSGVLKAEDVFYNAAA
jgi:hypothetical protein